MTADCKASIIIPVLNNWQATRNSLKNLAPTISDTEVIIIDAGSADLTPKACPFLGNELFGKNFRYLRNDANLSLAAAANLGAAEARGEFTVFLDASIQVGMGWLEPLLNDFILYRNLGASGPVHLSSGGGPLGASVRQMGLTITPCNLVVPLYEGIPEGSPLALKRRFLQLISPLCMAIPKNIFMEEGGFDVENDDIPENATLCVRMLKRGLRLTVNPESKVSEFSTGQPKNRSWLVPAEGDLWEYLKPDLEEQVNADGFELHLTPWLKFQCSISSEKARELDKQSQPIRNLMEALRDQPFWQRGWERLLHHSSDPADRVEIAHTLFTLFKGPETAFALYNEAKKAHAETRLEPAVEAVRAMCRAPAVYLREATTGSAWCKTHGLTRLHSQYQDWISSYDNFEKNYLQPMAVKFWFDMLSSQLCLSPDSTPFYTAWYFGLARVACQRECAISFRSLPASTSFSVLLRIQPGLSPRLLELTINSVRCQTWPNWELCISSDARCETWLKSRLEEYAKNDSRIRLKFMDGATDAGAGAVSALGMAKARWCLAIGQHDLLEQEALQRLAEKIHDYPDGLFFYSDMDWVNEEGQPHSPYFKNLGWDRDLFLVQDFASHLGCMQTKRALKYADTKQASLKAADYELLLNYMTDVTEDKAIHIPCVLYHCRTFRHDSASGTSFNSCGLSVPQQIVQAWLNRNNPGATAIANANGMTQRISYPVPRPRPLVSLLCHIREPFDFRLHAQKLFPRAGWPLEVVYICHAHDYEALASGLAQSANPHAGLVQVPSTFPDDYKLVLPRLHGAVLGFLPPDVIPQTDLWLQEIVTALYRPGVGAVAGKVILPDGSLAHAGYFADIEGEIKPLFAGADNPRYYDWASLQRTVDALDSLCLFTKTELCLANGLRPGLGSLAFQDYCLRLKQKQLRSIWVPHVVFNLTARPPKPKNEQADRFAGIWRNSLAPFNPNIHICGKELSLATPASFSPDFCPDEYLTLYPEIKSAGVNPVNHYMRIGKQEGRKGRLSRIDYTALTPQRIAKWRKAPKTGVVVCTSLCGDYERLLPPAYLNDGWDYICYSDGCRQDWGIWDVRPIPYDDGDATRKSRWAKMHLPELFPDARWVFWLDANIVIADDLSPLLADKDDGWLYMVRHPIRTCVYAEAQACQLFRKDSAENLQRQISAYKNSGFPHHWGMFENNFFLLKPQASRASSIFAQWWAEYSAYSRRDQLSLPYVFFKNKIRPHMLLPNDKNARTWPALHFLTHAETRRIKAPGD